MHSNLKPFLKWVGGKRSQLPFLLPQLPNLEGKIYIEPFLGGGSVFLSAQPKKAILNDINQTLIDAWSCIKNQKLVEEVIGHLKAIDNEWIASQGDKQVYLQFRHLFNTGEFDKSQRTALFLFLNRAGFNGLYRTNKTGKFNVPVGKNKITSYNFQHLRSIGRHLSTCDIEFTSESFEACFEQATENAVIYCDPPYVGINGFTEYSKEGFKADKLKKLLECSIDAAKKGAEVYISSGIDLSNFIPCKTIEFTRKCNIGSKKETRGRKPDYLCIFNGKTI